MRDAQANPLLAEFRERILRDPHAPLAACVDRRDPSFAEWLLPVIEEYASHRRGRGETLDFEEFRSAIPWIFDCRKLLDVAVDAAIDTGLVLGHSPDLLAAAMLRAHPLTGPSVVRSLDRWRDGARPPECEDGVRGVLPQEFGPEALDGGCRYVLTKRRGRLGRASCFDAIDRDDPSAGNGAAVPVEICVWTGPQAEQPPGLTELSHPALVRVRGRGVTAAGQQYLVHDRLEHGAMEPPGLNPERVRIRECVRLVTRLASGVEEAHARLIAHGAISPSFIRVDANKEPVLTGLGLVDTAADRSAGEPEYGVQARMAFVAPECWDPEHRELAPRSDLYGLAGLLYWLLTKMIPNGPSASAATLLLHDGVVPSRAYPAAVPKDLRSLCEWGLRIDPAARPVSVSEWRRSLEDWLAGRPTGRDPAWSTRTRYFVRRHRWLCLFIAVALGSITGWSLWVHDQRSTDRQLIARYNGRYEASMRAMDGWTKAMIATQDIDPSLRLVMFDVVRLSGGVEDGLALELAGYNAASARLRSDELAASDDDSLQAALWHVAAGYLSFETGLPDTDRYLRRARQGLETFLPPDDAWLQALDEMIRLSLP